MSANAYLPAHFPIEFDNNWSVLTQEMLNRLKAFVQVETVQGQEKQFNQIGQKDWQPITSRGSDTVITDTPTGKRLLRASAFDTADTCTGAETSGDTIPIVKLPIGAILRPGSIRISTAGVAGTSAVISQIGDAGSANRYSATSVAVTAAATEAAVTPTNTIAVTPFAVDIPAYFLRHP